MSHNKRLIYIFPIFLVVAILGTSIYSLVQTTQQFYESYHALEPELRPNASIFDTTRHRGPRNNTSNLLLKTLGVPPLRPFAEFLALKLLEGTPADSSSPLWKRRSATKQSLDSTIDKAEAGE